MTALEKQIEVARKNHDVFEKNIRTYNGRAIKRVNKLVSKGFNISVDDFKIVKAQFGYEVSVSDKVKDDVPWSLYYPVTSAMLSEHENKIHLQRNERRLEELLEKQKSKQQAAEAESRQYNNALEAKFYKILKPFYNKWWAEQQAWCIKHYEFIHSKLAEAREQYDKLGDLIYEELRRHGSTGHYRSLVDKKKRYGVILADKAGQYKTTGAYVRFMHKEFDDYYGSCMRRLTQKCSKFNVNQDKLKVRSPWIAEKGFEIEIFDDKPRIVHARVILAAVYSETVSQHLRYIVTERKLLETLPDC